MRAFIFSRYPGGKTNYHVPLLGHYNTAIEPFAGNACLSQKWAVRGIAKKMILADADPTIAAVYRCWLDPSTHQEVYERVDEWRSRMSDPKIRAQTWAEIKAGVHDWAGKSMPELAAVSIAFRHCAFKGFIRRAKRSGLYNVSPGRDQLAHFLENPYRFPEQRCEVIFKDDHSQVWDCLESQDNPLVVLDPPYYLPPYSEAQLASEAGQKAKQSSMTPCYALHDPDGDATLGLCLKSLEQAVKVSDRVITFNYFSDRLDSEIEKICKGLPLQKFIGEDLKYNFGSCVRTSFADECLWEVGRLSQRKGARSIVEQFSLI